ncbi:MAG: hypothetical protein AAB864_02700 [Patescibacteria group bacterium]
MAKKKQTDYKEWSYWVKRIYFGNGFRGWPATEMKRYFDSGYTPLSAYEQAAHRRRRMPPNVIYKTK